MKRLYKIIIFFLLIFLVGIYLTIKNINSTLSEEIKTEVVIVKPSYNNSLIKVL